MERLDKFECRHAWYLPEANQHCLGARRERHAAKAEDAIASHLPPTGLTGAKDNEPSAEVMCGYVTDAQSSTSEGDIRIIGLSGIVNLADPERLFPAPLGLSGAA